MKNIIFIKTLGISVFALSTQCTTTEQEQEKPNILFFLVDDMGWKDAGFMGSQYYETPNIDRLASEGMIFTNAYANAPNCAPSRACLLSGQYSPRHGVYTVGSPERGESRHRKLIPVENKTVLDTSFITIAEALKQNGYTTITLGKYHLGAAEDNNGPLTQGFDFNVAGGHEGMPPTYFYPYCKGDWCLKSLEEGEEGAYLTDRLTDEAIKFMDKHSQNPFFMYMSHYAVHTPVEAKEAMVEHFEQKEGDSLHNNPVYAAMIKSVDESLGKLEAKLEELGIRENTVIFFFSDNGGHGVFTNMHPLKGSKGMLYEGGIREPMFVKWPGKVDPGTRCDVPVIGIDFYPTIMDMTSTILPEKYTLDGQSIVPLLTGEGHYDKNRALFWHFPAYLQGYKQGMIWRTTPCGVIRKGKYKLIQFFEDNHLELYDLENDISETTNLVDSLPEKAKALHQQMINWRKQTNAPVPAELNPGFDPGARE